MQFYLRTRDHAFTGKEFTLMMDKELQLLKTTPCPENLETYYEHETYISHTDRSKTLVEKIYQLVKRVSLKKKESWIRTFAGRNLRVLDVGAGTGSFISYLRSRGWQADGVEPNPRARNAASKKGVCLQPSLLEIPDRQYDVLTLWHVLEHFRDLDKEVDALLSRIKEDGTLFIALPNFRSYDAKVYGEYWAAYDVPRHVWHLSRTSVEKIFGRKGWKVIGVRPMLFDSFYISLLSEKYRGGKHSWMNALWTGIRSNFHGWRTGEYSSMIYVLKKA
ncbi:2-polyprenyl-3-methyl-5-hydroxy-6-metoxy-1,4-benzoquinol methylase [Muriicola jejuensis]|uniref:Methyltransferase domain-containing protein n=1 Tax=Muriicola jejuensis TaxID=504488 RepID=A0A6P0UA70_9FLAO|nr:class I SAM-dependent methyltransferase [Muriicola jejuensis]NER09927.1 methyltransferase domain-containing protein [Muriicola jejuensis]SMP04715.1 2-polyprenyl-3-methyl-5-hydroxy-6-metoxy-1,4-benzoquinol methylase [Muriicola jejuensis]